MAIKDAIIKWFLLNVIVPRRAIFGTPGFITADISKSFYREVVLPENVFYDIEKRVVQKYKNGAEILYRIGKSFGFCFGKNNNLPNIRTVSKREFISFSNFLARYVCATWASKIEKLSIDIENGIFQLGVKNYIICSKNGLGYLLTTGVIAGIWSYSLYNKRLEAVHITCEGKGQNSCYIIAAPQKFFEKENIKYIICDEFPTYDKTFMYEKFNKPVKIQRYSLMDLINTNVIKYEKGMIRFGDERFFECDISLIYLLENDNLLKKIIFDVCFEWGKNFVEKNKVKDVDKFISNILTAFGWGDVSVLKEKKKVILNFYPWCELAKNSHFDFIRGLISGMLSFGGRDIKFKKFELNTHQEHPVLCLNI